MDTHRQENQKTIFKAETFVHQKVVKKNMTSSLTIGHLVFKETFDLLDKSPSFFGFVLHEVNLAFL